MTRSRIIAFCMLAAVVTVTDIDLGPGPLPVIGFGAPAEAEIGRPLTPLSYAGVARRTSRRVARRTAYRLNALPPNCVYGPYYGGKYYYCGGVYYQPEGNVYVQVVFD